MNGNNDFRQKLSDFMQGRYGTDDLARSMTFVVIVLLVVSMICMVAGAQVASTVISTIALAVILWTFFRMLSKNVSKRSKENDRWLSMSKTRKQCVRLMRDWKTYHKQYRVFRCPNCGEILKVPRGKGKIRVTCPNCHQKFDKKA